jgi:predicted phage baseplate assembly protein
MSSDTSALDRCGCCEGPSGPAPVSNAPGLPALRYRVDTQPGFYARMLQSLPLARSSEGEPAAPRPLGRLLTRASDDPTVAFLDASACVADVLGFYQERIANEGFLRTATERRSVLELARAIGYELKPGVAASVHLAFTVEDAPGAPGICTLAQGTQVQSVPPQGKLPQVFETSAEIVARAEWNALMPRQVRPADMAVLDVPAAGDVAAHKALVLLGPGGSFPSGTAGLHAGLQSLDLFRLDPDIAVDATVDALEVGRVFFTEAASGISVGDLLLFVAKRGTSLDRLVLRVTAVVAEPAMKRVRVDVEALPAPVADPPPPPAATWRVPYAIKPIMSFAKPQVSTVGFTSSAITTTVSSKAWRESDLQAMIGIQGWNATSLVKAITATQPSGPPLAPEAGAFAFGAKLGFFGNNAPKWKILPPDTENTNGNAYQYGWDVGDEANPLGGTLPRTIWEDSQGNSIAPLTYVERAVPNVTRTSWVVFDAPDVAAQVYTVLDARETSRADFGLSGRALRLRLADANGAPLPATPAEAFKFRTSTAYVASRRLDLADLPIDAPVSAGDTQIELDRMVLGLNAGQPVALVGDRTDLAGVAAAEVAVLSDIVHADGRSTLVLQKGLIHSYVRSSLKISANVVHATHGETVNEVLGNGDASVPNQRFTLKKPPITYLSATGGVKSTLEMRVAGVLWDEVPSLYGAAPDQPVYAARIADDASMQLTFGDGVQGARLPTGTLNVAARYRSGIGPDGEVAAATLTMLRAMPLGLRGVTNPIAAAGAEGPEQLADARRNAPLTLLTFDRVVSLLDYENYARAFPGIGKARGDVLWVDGALRIFLTVGGATGGPPGDDVLANLIGSIAAASDPAQRFDADAFVQRYFSCKARIAVDPRHVAADVLAAVSTALLAGFSFDARDLGQSVTAAEVVTLIHSVAGVLAVDLDELLPYTDDPVPADPAATAVPAFGARWDSAQRAALPAELLLINPAGVVLKEMTP